MSANLNVVNEFLANGKAAAEAGHAADAHAWAALAQAAATTHLSFNVREVADKLDRLATVVNQGRSWA